MASPRISNGPLGGAISAIPGTKQACSAQDNVHNWKLVYDYISSDSDPGNREQFFASLSRAQLNSLRVLQEWWRDDHGVRNVNAMFRAFVNSMTQGGDYGPYYGDYNTLLCFLWNHEFGTYRDVPDSTSWAPPSTYDLARNRQIALEAAAAQRLALRCYKMLHPNGPTTQQPGDYVSGNQADFLSATHIPASLDPCPWLKSSSHSKKEYPYYLWDIQDKRTVETSTINGDIKYVVISHTWGRWKLEGQNRTVPGVPWEVPCNSIFDIMKLPESFTKLPIPTRYLWFDLVCIPQDRSPLARSEIGRQATIFISAKHAMIWLNNVDSWIGLRHTISWLGLRYLSSSQNQKYEVSELLQTTKKLARTQTQLTVKAKRFTGAASLFEHPTGLWFWQERFEPTGWFTSLWTLQEICLRPDMLLCDRNWNVFSVGAVPVAMDDIVALFNQASHRIPENGLKSPPRGWRDLTLAFHHTGIRSLLNLSRMDVLLLGNRRYCKRRRFEAIMSVLGSTQWYTASQASSPRSIDSEPLIRGKYPLVFIKEVQKQVGAAFFGSFNFRPPPRGSYRYDMHNRIRMARVSATLMPVTVSEKAYMTTFVSDPSVMSTSDHPAVCTWKILDNGSVQLPQVGLIASWPPPPGPQRATGDLNPLGMTANIIATRPDSVSVRSDLCTWLGSFRPKSEKHAVCLLKQGGNMVHGILIERIYGSAGSEVPFVKIGNFWDLVEGATMSVDYQFPAMTDKKWLVI